MQRSIGLFGIFIRNLICLCIILCGNKLFGADTNVSPVANNIFWTPIVIEFKCDQTNAMPNYGGEPLNQWFRERNLFNTDGSSLRKLLTLTEVPGSDDLDISQFELPIEYDVLKTNWWSLDLGVINKDGDFASCTLYDCKRASNGDCLLCWNTSYDAPGKYDLRVRLDCSGPKVNENSITVFGPPLSFDSTNNLQFFESSSMFDSNSVPLVAKLIKPVATFTIEITTSDGRHLKAITGSTTNGWINLEWNLICDDGKKFQGDAINTEFTVTYPASQPRRRNNATQPSD